VRHATVFVPRSFPCPSASSADSFLCHQRHFVAWELYPRSEAGVSKVWPLPNIAAIDYTAKNAFFISTRYYRFPFRCINRSGKSGSVREERTEGNRSMNKQSKGTLRDQMRCLWSWLFIEYPSGVSRRICWRIRALNFSFPPILRGGRLPVWWCWRGRVIHKMNRGVIRIQFAFVEFVARRRIHSMERNSWGTRGTSQPNN